MIKDYILNVIIPALLLISLSILVRPYGVDIIVFGLLLFTIILLIVDQNDAHRHNTRVKNLLFELDTYKRLLEESDAKKCIYWERILARQKERLIKSAKLISLLRQENKILKVKGSIKRKIKKK